MDSMAPVFVVGGVNMDIAGTPGKPLRTGDSNPGHVSMSPGGVGRNIAENLSRLGRKVYLVSVLGKDAYADVIREHCANVRIDLSYSLTDPLGRTSTYLCLNEASGDLHAAVADMTIIDQMTPERLEPLLETLNQGSMVICDANLPEKTLGWMAEHVTVPMAADPVSTAKAVRLRPLLSRLTMVKPNLPEAELLVGAVPGGDAALPRLADRMHRAGVEKVFISLGSRGVWADDRHGGELLHCVPGRIVNTSGCGDAFVAAAADAYLRGLNTVECARRGLAAAAICAENPKAVSTGMSQEAINLRVVSGL